MTKALIVGILCALLGTPLLATTYYYAPSSAGSNNGTSCGNAYAWTDATHGISVAGMQATGGNGNILHMCPGTYTCGTVGTTGISFNASGSSSFPVTLQGDAGGVTLACAYWGGNFISSGSAAILCVGQSYILIDGIAAADFVVKNTNNGSASLGYGNQQSSTLINVAGGCPHTEVRNVTAGPTYLTVQDDTGGSSPNDTVGLVIGGADFQSAHNNIIENAEYPLAVGYSGTGQISSLSVYNNTIDYGCHHVNIGDGANNSTSSGFSFYGNTIGPHNQLWGSTACHQDGFLIGASNPGSVLSSLSIYNNTITTDMCSIADSANNCTGEIFVSGGFSGVNIYNNVIAYTFPNQGGEGLIVSRPGYLSGSGSSGGQSGFNILNNTFIGTNSVTAACSECAGMKLTVNAGYTSAQTTWLSKNNIYYGFLDADAIYLDENGTLAGIFTGIDYNLNYNINKMGVEFANGVTYFWSSPPVWTVSHATNSFPGYDMHGHYGDPMLNVNYVPQSGSAAIGLGANLTSLCTGALTALCNDASGQPRGSSGAWTVGANNNGTQVATPTISPASGPYTSPQTVTIGCASGATCYYTQNGSTPTCSSTTYTGAFSQTVPGTVEAIGCEAGYTNSNVATSNYVLTGPPGTTINGGGTISSGPTVKLLPPTDLTATAQ